MSLSLAAEVQKESVQQQQQQELGEWRPREWESTRAMAQQRAWEMRRKEMRSERRQELSENPAQPEDPKRERERVIKRETKRSSFLSSSFQSLFCLATRFSLARVYTFPLILW